MGSWRPLGGNGKLELGEAVRISTGGMLPPGADAVLMVEHTETVGPEGIAGLPPGGPVENVISRR